MYYKYKCGEIKKVDGEYVELPGNIEEGYPKPLSLWHGVPDIIDTAFMWKNGQTYFFKGSEYYRYNDKEALVGILYACTYMQYMFTT